LMGLSAMQSGLIMLPGSLMVAISMPFIGYLSDKASPRFLTLFGMICLVYSMYLYKDISIYMSYWDIIWPTMIRGVGMACLMAPIMTLALNAVPRRSAGMASSMMSIIQQVGGAVGIAILSTALDNRTKFHMSTVGPMLDRNSPTFINALHQLMARAHDIGLSKFNAATAAQGTLAKYIAMAQMGFAFQDAFVFSMILIVFAIIPVFLLPNKSVTHHPEETAEVIDHLAG
jgi:DHA2 family multidrug resistance protein